MSRAFLMGCLKSLGFLLPSDEIPEENVKQLTQDQWKRESIEKCSIREK